jgi:transposase
MAFLRVEKKKSGTYLRIIQSYKDNGKPKHKTLYSLGKVEDYPSDQLQRIAEKLLELSGAKIEDIIGNELEEIRRINYGYALVIKHLWKTFNLDKWVKQVNLKHRIKFNWLSVLELMIAERLNDPCSKLASFEHQQEYIGFSDESIDLHHFYRTLDLLSNEQESLKTHLFKAQQNLFTTKLDVVFYDVTTLYFDSQKVEDNQLRQKGYSKDGKAHKTQVVLGLLVDKMRNPITYQIYQGNTYEGGTMITALEDLKTKFPIDKVIAVADSAMIDKNNRDYIESSEDIDYIIGDRIKNLPKKIAEELIASKNQKKVFESTYNFTYHEVKHQDRRIICTYSEKRARKDRKQREKLIEKAKKLLENPSQLKQSKKRGAGRFIKQESEEKYSIDLDKIKSDQKWDGFKALSTTTDLKPQQVIEKYTDLFEVEHAFRSLKSQLQIRPIFHWTDKRIEGHIAMCFMAYTFLNHIRLSTSLTEKEVVRTLDKMQLSEVKEKNKSESIYLRSKIDDYQNKLIKNLKIQVPKDTSSQITINHMFI